MRINKNDKLLEIGVRFDGVKLKEAREKKNLTQEDVARQIGGHQQTVNRHENNEILPSSYYLIWYSIIYDISIDSIIFN